MKNLIEHVYEQIQLQEGTAALERVLVECYLTPGISTKALAVKCGLPVPLTAAVKREFIRAGALTQDRGVRCTPEGEAWVDRQWGYSGIDKALYHQLIAEDSSEWKKEVQSLLTELEHGYALRPQANVQLDQAKCTPETSLKRAVLSLREQALIGKKILCVGDDDLVSVSAGFLLKRLFPDSDHRATEIEVVDIDSRFLSYIEELAAAYHLPIRCRLWDLREPLPDDMLGEYHSIFTDPPYTLQGMSLFLSRGLSALRQESGLSIFLSFAHKPPGFTLSMQRAFVNMGLTVCANYPHFNIYEGAGSIANRSQMFVLRTTDQSAPEITGSFQEEMYTGEVNRTLRIYQCKRCKTQVRVGQRGEASTIEQLKHRGCPRCTGFTFELIRKVKQS
ncbi:methyltransferase [Paenibacillus faecis]|uniref:bis-aminopropyl spermidine synthase family protein n=1 Tax=Paenibacillus faecis TaxID=862114 RepID=UPI001B2C6849|nr:bis-aminopropyl spermidine synthase family protein [Paenibacillus faecis]GIO85059.1 methyltransferase [Paenibacillus faecis]